MRMRKVFFQLHDLIGNLLYQISEPMIVDLLMIKIRIIWPDTAQMKECVEILRGVQSDTGPDQTVTEWHNIWKSRPG
jgi:acetolactate synthase small subunit